MAAMMAMNPTASLPRQSNGWADLKAAYRLLNNDKIDPGDIGVVHRKLTRQACFGHKLILCVQDDSDLSAVKIEGEQNLMHSTLAVTPGGSLLTVNVVYLQELNPPEGDEPVDWMLLTSEPVTSLQEALVIVEHYRVRWVIEEWHRAVKEGCRLEHSQLTERSALLRLTAVVSVVGVRLIQLRDLADNPTSADQPQHLQQLVPTLWIQIAAALARLAPEQLTPKQFWQTIARRGGWIGRRSDGRPGWKTIWRGWRDIQQMVEGAELVASLKIPVPLKCG